MNTTELPKEVLQRIDLQARELFPHTNGFHSGDVNSYGIDCARHGYIAGSCAEYSRSRWISVKDALPEIGVRVLCVVKKIRVERVLVGVVTEKGWSVYDTKGRERDSERCLTVTLWQPLTPLPTK